MNVKIGWSPQGSVGEHKKSLQPPPSHPGIKRTYRTSNSSLDPVGLGEPGTYSDPPPVCALYRFVLFSPANLTWIPKHVGPCNKKMYVRLQIFFYSGYLRLNFFGGGYSSKNGNLQQQKTHVELRNFNLPTFHYTGWLMTGSLYWLMKKSPYNWVVFIPYTT